MKDTEKTIGGIVAEDYRTAKVFQRYGIDFCCGGNTPFSSACAEKGIDPALILKDLEMAKNDLANR